MEKNSSLIEHAIIILPGLIIGYFLLITNPPSDLLQYNDNLKMATTYHLSGPEILNHLSSIAIFIALFLLISVFLVFVCSRLFSRKRGKLLIVDIFLVTGSIALLGLIALPYYGIPLTILLYMTGSIGIFVALLISYHPFIIRSLYLVTFDCIALSFYFIIFVVSGEPYSLFWRLVEAVLLGILVFSVLLMYVEEKYMEKKLKRKRKARKGRLT